MLWFLLFLGIGFLVWNILTAVEKGKGENGNELFLCGYWTMYLIDVIVELIV